MDTCQIEDCLRLALPPLPDEVIDIIQRRVNNFTIKNLCEVHYNKYWKFYEAKQAKICCNPLNKHKRPYRSLTHLNKISLDLSIKYAKQKLKPGQFICLTCIKSLSEETAEASNTSGESIEDPLNISTVSASSDIQASSSKLQPVEEALGAFLLSSDHPPPPIATS